MLTDEERETVATAPYLTNLLVTDTQTYKVVGRTPKTLKLQPTVEGAVARSENWGGNPYPCVWNFAEDLPEGEGRIITVRLRKDGTYRIANWARPLYPAHYIDGKPVTYTDYRE